MHHRDTPTQRIHLHRESYAPCHGVRYKRGLDRACTPGIYAFHASVVLETTGQLGRRELADRGKTHRVARFIGVCKTTPRADLRAIKGGYALAGATAA